MWFEIYKSGKLTVRGDDIIGDLNWDSELMSVPSLSFDLPMTYYDYIQGREEIKIFVNRKCFWGIITGVTLNKADETISVDVTHVVHEWTYRQISINNAVRDGKVQFLFKSDADKVKSLGDFSMSASNFECLPSATNFIELAKVSVWNNKTGEVIYPSTDITAQAAELRADQLRYDQQINALMNGNVQYQNRPLVSSSVMQEKYPEFPSGDWATTYSQGVTIGSSPLYTIEISPIKEDGTVLSQTELDNYINALDTSNGVSGVLSSDTDRLILEIQEGDYDPNFWEPWYDSYDELKQPELWIRLQLMALADNSTITYKLFERKETEGSDEPTYEELSALPVPSDRNSTESCYIRFYTSVADDLYVQVQVTVSYEPEQDNGELDIKNASVYDQLEDIYNDANFAYPGWTIDYQDESENTLVDYVYSRQNKLDALTKTMELTEDLFWRVGFTNEKLIEVGKFGEQKNWIISVRPTGGRNISIVEEPEIDYDFNKVVNVATVYSEKSASGMSSLTLREVYSDPDLQEEGFPVVILRSNVNNERDYTKYITQFPALAPNNELEYAVIDEESVALEDGHLIEGTFAFNDLTAFTEEKDDEGDEIEITDQDRIDAAVSAYKATIRKLKQARRSYKITLTTEQLPPDIKVGDKVRFIYQNLLWMFEPCSHYFKYILGYDDWFYVTKIDYQIDANEAEVDKIVLEKFLKIDRETKESV